MISTDMLVMLSQDYTAMFNFSSAMAYSAFTDISLVVKWNEYFDFCLLFGLVSASHCT